MIGNLLYISLFLRLIITISVVLRGVISFVFVVRAVYGIAPAPRVWGLRGVGRLRNDVRGAGAWRDFP